MKVDTTIREVTEDEKNSWDSVVSHPLQSWAWGKFRRTMGVECLRFGTYRKNVLTAGWQVFFHHIGPLTVGYFPKGPLPDSAMIGYLKKQSLGKKLTHILFEPDVRFRPEISVPKDLRPAHRPLFTPYTFVLDLTQSEDALLANMHPKTRYNLKVARKHHVTIREDNSPAAFRAYLSLLTETTRRQKFYAHNETYHRTLWKIMHQSGIARIWTATYEREIVTAWMIFVFADTVYYPYGASSSRHRNTMASNLLLWEIARWAKHNNLRSFDLWGALGPDPDTNDPWYGFHKFKSGYNPEHVRWIGSYDMVTSPLLYRLYCTADTLRWMYLKIRS